MLFIIRFGVTLNIVNMTVKDVVTHLGNVLRGMIDIPVPPMNKTSVADLINLTLRINLITPLYQVKVMREID